MSRLAAIVLIAACHHDPQPTAPVATRDAAPSVYQELDAKMKPVFAAVITLEPAIAAHDCAKLATQLRQFGADHGAELGDAAQLRDKLGPDDRDEFEKAHEVDVSRMARRRSTMRSTRVPMTRRSRVRSTCPGSRAAS